MRPSMVPTEKKLARFLLPLLFCGDPQNFHQHFLALNELYRFTDLQTFGVNPPNIQVCLSVTWLNT